MTTHRSSAPSVRLALAFGLTTSLTACSSAPSSSDAQKAIAAHYEQMLGGSAQVKEFRDFGLAGCKKAEVADGYVCDVTGSIVMDFAGVEDSRPFNAPIRFSKATGTWTAHKR